MQNFERGFKKLVGEIAEKPFTNTLSQKGLQLYHPPESLPNQPDDPMVAYRNCYSC
jgi:hypothetical protein